MEFCRLEITRHMPPFLHKHSRFFLIDKKHSGGSYFQVE